MGGDLAPQVPVRAVITAAQQLPHVELILVGDETPIRQVGGLPPNVQVVHATEVVSGEDDPVRAVRRKRDASLVVAARMVRDGSAEAMISAGNTGALVAAGLLIIGRIPGVDRPALCPALPTFNQSAVLLLDAGATMDAKPLNLLQYAHMAAVYSEVVFEKNRPRIGLLNVGTEEGKGNYLAKEAFPLLQQSGLNFIGNIEARELLNGICDIAVCDGFVGNVVLKLVEGLGLGFLGLLKQTVMQSAVTRLAGALLRPSLRKVRTTFDYAEYGGSPVLGVNGGCFKAHGSSNERAWVIALTQIVRSIEQDTRTRITRALETVME